MAEEIKGKWAWEDYPEVQVKGYEEVPSVANQQRLADINKYLEVADEEVEPEVGQQIKRPLQALGYAVRKYATDPIYKGVDVIAQKGGNKIAEMLGARLSDKDKYGDVDFGKNAEREGYETMGDYFRAKDKYENDYQKYRENLDDPNAWYADASGEDVIVEPTDADSQFASLTGTKAYEDWQPDTMVGKVAKGASGIAGDMLPANLEGYAIENAPKMLGTLSPVFKELKKRKEAANFWNKRGEAELRADRPVNADYDFASARKYKERFNDLLIDVKQQQMKRKAIEEALMSEPGQAKNLKEMKDTLTTDGYEEYLDTLARVNGNAKTYARNNALRLQEMVNPKDSPANLKSIARNAGRTPKPLPNPAAQRAEALRRNARPTLDELYPDGGSVQAAKEFADLSMPELKTGAFNFGDNKKAINRFIKQCEENNVRYALRNTDTGMVVDVLSDSETMPYLTETYRNMLKIK